MDKIALQYLAAPIIETALADAYQRGAKDWDLALGTFLPGDWEKARATFVKGAIVSYAEPLAATLAIKGHTAAYDVLFERERQQEQERFGPTHDDMHVNKELAYAASAYLGPIWGIDTAKPDRAPDVPPIAWPWGAEWWKPGGNDLESYRRRLVKGAALAIAEIERVDRMIASGAKADV